jgi:hypothetical protein
LATTRRDQFQLSYAKRRRSKPIAAKAGIPDTTYRALRRTFATQFQRHGSPKDA